MPKLPAPIPEKPASRLLDWLSKGRTLAAFCESEGMTARQVYRWVEISPDYADAYRRAREDGYHLIAEDLLRIADAATPETVQVARLRADVRRWLLARWMPRAYGERRAIEHSGGGSATIVVQTGVPRTLQAKELGDPKETDPGGGGPSPVALAGGGEEHTAPHTPLLTNSEDSVS